jgi:asparagine synthase (glutamine-hydrolysing)
MCGIAGLVDYKKTSTREILENMTRSLAHRGPDGEGYYWSDQNDAAVVGLGHRRLSIIDLSNHAAQPMHYKNLHITFNGEIYNYQEIKNELIKSGHSFSTGSDTEVILHAFEEWGSSMIHRFIGMFAFVIYNSQEQQIFAFRDRVGVKPFYYYYHNDLWIFGSELKAFYVHPAFEKKICLDAVASFLQYGNVPAPHSIFQHTAKLLPGHYLTLNIPLKELKTHKYWSVYDSYNKPKIDIEIPEAIAETERIFQKAFDFRMVADVPVGVFLSGGYDSTCVTAILQRNRSEKIKTFTIGTTDKKTDEAPFARQIAGHLGTDHTEYYCTNNEAKEIIPTLPYFYDEPFADSSAIPTILVSKLARKKVTVALSADGGDELFAGYTKYQYLINLKQRLSRLPKPFRQMGYAVMNTIPVQSLPVLRSNQAWVNKYKRLNSLLKAPSLQNVFSAASQLYTKAELDKLLINAYSLRKTGYDSTSLQKIFYDDLSYMMAMDYETYLNDDIMQKVDRASMSVSLESREPLLDQHIIEWTAALPLHMKFNSGQTKFLLKEIVHKYVPKEIMERPKSGFTIPVYEWMKNDFKELVHLYFNENYIKQQGLFDKEVTNSLLKGFYNDGKVPVEKMWYLLMFQLWYDRWILKG